MDPHPLTEVLVVGFLGAEEVVVAEVAVAVAVAAAEEWGLFAKMLILIAFN